MYSQGNGPRIFELRKKLAFRVRMIQPLMPTTLDLKVSGIDEYSNYRSCTCGHQVEDYTMAFLIGLNDT